MPRLFVAINVPSEHRRSLAHLQSDHTGIRWTPPHQFHLTLRFLGDVNDDKAQSVEAALAGINPPGSVLIRITGATGFPSRRSPRLIAAIIEQHPLLMKLHASIESAMQECGFSPESRDFRPHITLGRIKDSSPKEIHEFLRSQEAVSLSFHADEIALTESTLSKDGAQHRTRTAVPLI